MSIVNSTQTEEFSFPIINNDDDSSAAPPDHEQSPMLLPPLWRISSINRSYSSGESTSAVSAGGGYELGQVLIHRDLENGSDDTNEKTKMRKVIFMRRSFSEIEGEILMGGAGKTTSLSGLIDVAGAEVDEEKMDMLWEDFNEQVEEMKPCDDDSNRLMFSHHHHNSCPFVAAHCDSMNIARTKQHPKNKNNLRSALRMLKKKLFSLHNDNTNSITTGYVMAPE